jgi:hypothetical protein
MAYGRRKGYKRPARKGVSKLTKAKPTAITTLAKAVKSIQSKMRQKTIMLNYGQQFDNGNLSSDVDIFKLSNYSSWTAIFGTQADDGTANAMVHKSFGMDMYLSASTETDRTNFTIFLVSLKDDARSGIFNNSNGNLSLTGGIDYYNNAGFVLLNKKSFNIHSVKRCVLGNNGVGLGSSTAQTQYGTDRRYYFKQRCNKKVVSAGGNWTGLGCSPDPSDNYYLLIFNDNGIFDATYPRVQLNIVHTVEQLA